MASTESTTEEWFENCNCSEQHEMQGAKILKSAKRYGRFSSKYAVCRKETKGARGGAHWRQEERERKAAEAEARARPAPRR